MDQFFLTACTSQWKMGQEYILKHQNDVPTNTNVAEFHIGEQ